MIRYFCLVLILCRFLTAQDQPLKNSMAIESLKEGQKAILQRLGEMRLENHKLLHGDGERPGLKHQVLINTEFREDVRWFLGVLLTVFIGQLATLAWFGNKTIKLTKEIKNGGG